MSKIALEYTVDCPHCDNGQIEVGPTCFKPASECCGGCYNTETCEECDGFGEFTRTLDEDQIRELLSILEERDSESFFRHLKQI
jgi:hypothetical protein